MKKLEIPETLAQVADRIKDPYGIPMGKKIMSLDDNEEFVAMVLSFAERKSMTISNIKDAIQEAVAYMEDNAILSTDPEDLCYSETVKINAEAGPKYYMSNEEVIECMRNIRQPLEQKKPDAKTKDGEDEFEIHEKIDDSKDKNEIMAKRISSMLLNSYSPDGVSVREVDEVLRKVHEMFVCTTIVPIDD